MLIFFLFYFTYTLRVIHVDNLHIFKQAELISIVFLSLAIRAGLRNLLYGVTIRNFSICSLDYVVLFRLNTQPREIAAVHFLLRQAKYKRYKRQNEDKFLNGLR